MKRRDVFVYVAKPGKVEEAKQYLAEWLGTLDAVPGFLGGSVIEETAGELLPGTLAMLLEYESSEAIKGVRPAVEGTPNPLFPDIKGVGAADQGAALFGADAESGAPPELLYSRGGGLLARVLHLHAMVIHEHVNQSQKTTPVHAGRPAD